MRHVFLALVAAPLLAFGAFAILFTGLAHRAPSIVEASPPDFVSKQPGSTLGLNDTFTPTWAVARVDAEKTFSALTDRSFVFDNSDQPHVAYGGDHLYYATHNGSEWVQETVDPAWQVGDHASIAVDGVGQPHIAYYDTSNQDLKYAYFDGAAWQVETVDSAGSVGTYTSIAVRGNRVHIAYHDSSTGHIKYAERESNAWTFALIDSTTIFFAGSSLSLALDSTDRPHIAYGVSEATQELRYASWTGSAWVTETVASGSGLGQYASLAIHGDTPHVSFLFGQTQDLIYATWNGSTWITETVDPAVGSFFVKTSISVDSAGIPYIAYTNTNNGDLMLAERNGPVWTLSTIESSERIFHKTVAVDSLGHAAIAYLVGDGLKYAAFNGVSWEYSMADRGRNIGNWVDLALAPTAPYTPYLSYAAGSSLRFAAFEGVAWVTQTIEAVSIGAGTSLVLEPVPPHRPHIAYYDVSNFVLKHAYWTGSAWVIQTVDGTGVDSNNSGVSLRLEPIAPYTPHVAYIGTGNLRYASWTGSNWMTETIETKSSSIFVIGSPALGLQPQSPYTPSIAFDNWSTGQVRYAEWTGATWAKQNVYFHGTGSRPLDMALDSAGLPHLVYAHNQVVHAQWNGSVWVTQTVSGDDPFSSISLALDSLDRAHIGYPGVYARPSGGGWAIESFGGAPLRVLALEGGAGRARVAGSDGDLVFAWQGSSGLLSTSGEVFGAYGLATFQFPANAFTETVVLSYTAMETSELESGVGVLFEIQAASAANGASRQLAPGQTYTVEVVYDQAEVPAGYDESYLALYFWNGAGWIKEQTSVVDSAANSVTAFPSHISVWAVLAEDDYRLFLPIIQY
jgi:hypothetical protein